MTLSKRDQHSCLCLLLVRKAPDEYTKNNYLYSKAHTLDLVFVFEQCSVQFTPGNGLLYMDKRNYFISQRVLHLQSIHMEYGLHSKQHHPHPWYRTKDEVVKNEQLTELIYISASGVALSPGQARSWDHLGGLKSLPNYWHLFLS